MSNDKLRKAAEDVIAWFSKRAVAGWAESEDGLRINTLRAALADSADAPENDQTVRARKQAAGLDRWAKVLEAHEPESSAAGILMLHEAAKTLRCFTDAPLEPTEEMVKRGAESLAASANRPVADWRRYKEPARWALRAALAVAQKEGK